MTYIDPATCALLAGLTLAGLAWLGSLTTRRLRRGGIADINPKTGERTDVHR